MGNEILYCNWCSNRILGTDYVKGAAVKVGNHACCSSCLPKVMASLSARERDHLIADLARPSTVPAPSSTKMPRVVVQAPPPSPAKPPIKIFAAIGIALVSVVVLVVALSGSAPEPAVQQDIRPVAAPPDREKSARAAIDKAREGARSNLDIDLQVRLWEEAVLKSERTPSAAEAMQERTASLARRKGVYAEEVAKLGDNANALAGARKKHDGPEWAEAIDRKLEELKKAGATGAPLRQPTAADGLLCIEAEHYDAKIDVGQHAWTLVTSPGGFQGTGGMAPLPNLGTGIGANQTAHSPRIDYRINFVKPGQYFLWLRGYAETDGENSVYVGLDAKSLNSLHFPIKNWSWNIRNIGATPFALEIAKPGVHTLNFWMREDGLVIDRILITTDEKYVLKDAGPPGSPR